MKRLIVHIGPHRTGSTAIQEWLRTNRWTLLRHGYIYLNHWRRFSMLPYLAPMRIWVVILHWFSMITRLRVIISAEGLCGRATEMGVAPTYYANRLHDIFGGLSVDVVAFDRDEDETWASLNRMEHIDTPPLRHLLNPGRRLHPIRRVFPWTWIIDYRPHESVTQFLDLLGIKEKPCAALSTG